MKSSSYPECSTSLIIKAVDCSRDEKARPRHPKSVSFILKRNSIKRDLIHGVQNQRESIRLYKKLYLIFVQTRPLAQEVRSDAELSHFKQRNDATACHVDVSL